MFELGTIEIILFVCAAALYLSASVAGVLQLRKTGENTGWLVTLFVISALAFEMILLVFRAIEIKAIPLTGLFESMLVLTAIFATVFLVLRLAFTQVWFSSITVWGITAMMLLTAFVAEPAAEPVKLAATPWAIAHGVAMILAGVAVVFSQVCNLLRIIAVRKLKNKQICQVIGRIPNIEKLDKMTLSAIQIGFVLLTFGLVSGLGLVLFIKADIIKWLIDPKVISTITAWALLGVVLALDHFGILRAKIRGYIVTIAMLLIFFAILGVAILGITQHSFSA